MVIDMTHARARQWVSRAESVTVFTGAGISTESGIADYRGPQGTWTTDPDAAKYVDIDYYVSDPDIRRGSWQRRANHPAWTVKPNRAHEAIAALERRGKLNKLITQNIDGLHQAAGSSPENVLEIHGNMFGVVCLECDARTSMTAALERVAGGDPDPHCLNCGGILKSTTIFFGQQLDHNVLESSTHAAASCDVFIAIGTSLTVFPAAGLVDIALQAGSTVLICNSEPTPYDALAADVLREPIGEVLPELLAQTAALQPSRDTHHS